MPASSVAAVQPLARRLDRQGLERAVRLGLAGAGTRRARQVGEERLATPRALQRHRRGAARHPQVARLAVLARERAPCLIGQIERVDASASRIQAAQRHV